MGQYLLLLVVALTVGGVVFGVTVLVSSPDTGLGAAEPDGRAVPLPGTRPLMESDINTVRFDTALRGYRMAQVDQALRRTAYDIGYKDELISVLEAEVVALREGRMSDAEVLRRAREAAVGPAADPVRAQERPGDVEPDDEADADLDDTDLDADLDGDVEEPEAGADADANADPPAEAEGDPEGAEAERR
jgi:DivIVA domain-containing protein